MSDGGFRNNSTDVDKILDADVVSRGGLDHYQQRVNLPPVALRYDAVSSVLAYLGIAAPGTAESAALWQIRKLVFTAGGNITITWADGDVDYNNIWNDRAGLTYV